MPKTMLETQLDAATDAHLDAAPQGARLNGMPLFPMPSAVAWADKAVCVHCRQPVASMDIVFCDSCGDWFERLKQRSAK